MQEQAILSAPADPLEQGQINWSQAAPPTEARLGNSQHTPKWAE